MEGPSHGHVGNDATGPRDPTTEQGLEADATVCFRARAPPWQRDGMVAGTQAARQRQEGNDRGDAERLSTGIILRGVRVALRGSRNGSDPPSSACGCGGVRNVRARNAANLMTGSGMQQARKPPGGGTRRSGAKPHGRNRTFGVDLREPKRDGHVAREWTPGDDVGGEANGASFGQLAELRG
jgi:hypothetical protein